MSREASLRQGMSDMTSLGIHLAGHAFRIEFDKAASGCPEIIASLFQGFLGKPEPMATRLRISSRTNSHPIPLSLTEIEMLKEENRLPGEKLTGIPLLRDMVQDLGLDQKNTVIAGVRGAVLAFQPRSGDGCIVLLNTRRVEELITPLYRLIFLFLSVILGRSGFFLAHGAAVEMNRGGLVFLGRSGAGKTTLAQQWTRGNVLSDDAPAITVGSQGFEVWTSPYSQFDFQKTKAPDRHTLRLPLKRAYFLRREGECGITPLHTRHALACLIQQIHGLNHVDTSLKKKIYETAHRMSQTIPAFDIAFAAYSKEASGTLTQIIGA
ncbi:MAG: hypothetical protein JRD68_14110 [Deltaproteobacteria bacterium]|nr:hypothetical protein [Deltaproteobacteria bacterium]